MVPWSQLLAIAPLLARITPLPVNAFPNMPAANVPNIMTRNPSFRSFASFVVVSLALFINKPDIKQLFSGYHPFLHWKLLMSFPIHKFSFE